MNKLIIREKEIDFSKTVGTLAILNCTPDSFSDGGRRLDQDAIRNFVDDCLNHQVDIIDVGGESTRPGASVITAEEEINRVCPVIEIIRQHSDIIISIDSTKSKVVEASLSLGADMVNDISAGVFDVQIMPTVARFQVPYILMHTPARPEQMQSHTHYTNLLESIMDYFKERLAMAESYGIKQIIIDPGFGFGKRLEQNYHLLTHLDQFLCYKRPILVGASRKSMLDPIGNRPVTNREEETLMVHMAAMMKGARLFRMHHIENAGRMKQIMNLLLKEKM